MRAIWLLLLIAFLATPTIAIAQATEPVGTVSTGDDQIFRSYDNPDVYFDATAGISAFGSIYEGEAAASRSLDTTAPVFAASLESGASTEEGGAGDYEFGALEDVELAQIGDESTAGRLPFVLFGSFEGEYGIVAVRQGTWVQVLIGFGVGEVDVIADLEALANALQPRWPSEDPIAVREDGLRTGGIWNMAPVPEDLPAAFEVDPEFEEGPAATVDEVVPVGTREPAVADATPAGATPASDRTTERQIPLVPTRMPDAATPPSAPDVVEPATPAIEEIEEEPLEPTVEATPAQATPSLDEPTEPIEPVDVDEATAEPTVEPTLEDLPTETVEPTVAPSPTEDADQVIEPLPTTVEPTAEEEATDPGTATAAINERLAQPFDASVDIIIAEGNYERNDDGSCSGSGLVEALTVDGELALRDDTGDALGTTTIDQPGVLAYDTVLEQDICYMTVQFTDVTARAEYVLVAGESVIGRLSYQVLTSGEPALVVVGAE